MFPIWVGVLVKGVSFSWWLLCLFSLLKVSLSSKRRNKNSNTRIYIIIHFILDLAVSNLHFSMHPYANYGSKPRVM